MILTLSDRFWPKVDRHGPVPDHDPSLGPCWIWTAGQDGKGYGHISAPPPETSRKLKAHRVAYELLIGPIPDGLELDHLCRVTLCVRPSHLEPVAHALNIDRAPRSIITIKREQTTCGRGHPLVQKATQRRCIECRREQSRESSARAQAKARR